MKKNKIKKYIFDYAKDIKKLREKGDKLNVSEYMSIKGSFATNTLFTIIKEMGLLKDYYKLSEN